MRHDRTPHQLSGEAARQLARQVRYLERLPRNRQPHRRRSVSRGGAPIAIATLTETLSPGGSASADFVVGGTGSATVNDKLLCASDSLASGTTVVIAMIAGKWYVINAVCPC